jgi:hypothetical protein
VIPTLVARGRERTVMAEFVSDCHTSAGSRPSCGRPAPSRAPSSMRPIERPTVKGSRRYVQQASSSKPTSNT